MLDASISSLPFVRVCSGRHSNGHTLRWMLHTRFLNSRTMLQKFLSILGSKFREATKHMTFSGRSIEITDSYRPCSIVKPQYWHYQLWFFHAKRQCRHTELWGVRKLFPCGGNCSRKGWRPLKAHTNEHPCHSKHWQIHMIGSKLCKRAGRGCNLSKRKGPAPAREALAEIASSPSSFAQFASNHVNLSMFTVTMMLVCMYFYCRHPFWEQFPPYGNSFLTPMYIVSFCTLILNQCDHIPSPRTTSIGGALDTARIFIQFMVDGTIFDKFYPAHNWLKIVPWPINLLKMCAGWSDNIETR